jgi:LAO/AO transport system kinase
MVAAPFNPYLVLMLAGAGDELQGIKRGILELADMIAVNKADAGNEQSAERARREYASALELMHAHKDGWKVPVIKCSGLTGDGLAALWAHVERHQRESEAEGKLGERRREQQRRWMWQMVESELMAALRDHRQVKSAVPELERGVRDGTLTATLAAARILEAFGMRR